MTTLRQEAPPVFDIRILAVRAGLPLRSLKPMKRWLRPATLLANIQGSIWAAKSGPVVGAGEIGDLAASRVDPRRGEGVAGARKLGEVGDAVVAPGERGVGGPDQIEHAPRRTAVLRIIDRVAPNGVPPKALIRIWRELSGLTARFGSLVLLVLMGKLAGTMSTMFCARSRRLGSSRQAGNSQAGKRICAGA